MAKKKDKKGTSFLQSTYDIATAGVNKKSGSWTDKAYDAAGGGNYGNPGPQNTGYSIDWSKIDFGKSSLERVMNQTEASAKRTETNKLKKDCAESGGLWNPTLGRCQDRREKKEDPDDDKLFTCDCGVKVKTEAECEKACKETDEGGETKPCYCDGVYMGRISATKKCEDELPCEEEKPDPDKLVDCECGGQEKTQEDCDKKCKETDGGRTKPCECDGEVVTRVPINQDCPPCDEPDPNQCAEDEYWDGSKCVKKSTTDVPDKKDVKKKDLGFSNQADVDDFNQSFGTQTLNKKQQKELNENYSQGNVNPYVGGLDGLSVDGYESVFLGGGNIRRSKNRPVETTFDRKGNVTGFNNRGKVRGNAFDYSFKFKTNESTGLKTIKFNKLRGAERYVFQHFGFASDSRLEMSATQWKDFRAQYDQTLKEAQDKLKELQKQGLKNSDLINAFQSSYSSQHEAAIASEVLKMNARGFFNGDFSNEDTPVNFKSQFDYTQPIPVQFKSPFASRSAFRSRLKTRENWMPTQPPMNYGSPLHQQEQDISQMEFGSIWEKIQAYGSDMDKKIDKFIKHSNYNAETDKPINSFQNQEWVGIITKWLQEQKAAMIKANKNNDEKQRISTAVNTLIQDVTTYSGKFLDWIARNAGDQTEGNVLLLLM